MTNQCWEVTWWSNVWNRWVGYRSYSTSLEALQKHVNETLQGHTVIIASMRPKHERGTCVGVERW